MIKTAGKEGLTVVEGKGTKPTAERTTRGSTGGRRRARPGDGDVGPRAQIAGAKPRVRGRNPGTGRIEPGVEGTPTGRDSRWQGARTGTATWGGDSGTVARALGPPGGRTARPERGNGGRMPGNNRGLRMGPNRATCWGGSGAIAWTLAPMGMRTPGESHNWGGGEGRGDDR
jgi:hypothetical protein